MKTAMLFVMMLATATLGLLAADPASAAPLGCSDTPVDGDTDTRCDAGSCFVDYDPFRPSAVGCRDPCFGVGLHGGYYMCV